MFRNRFDSSPGGAPIVPCRDTPTRSRRSGGRPRSRRATARSSACSVA